VIVRYRYRVYPGPHQEMMLARTFGCARVVFNDALRVRDAAHAAGEKVSDTEVQRRVITLAKTTPQREWLGEVASVAHRKTREARADHLHKTALRLVRDNQAVYVEDLAVSGLARTRLAKSVHDAGWATLVRLLEEKAERHGRAVVKVSRWFPSSQICSACGVRDSPKPLGVRQWTCGGCGTAHDRDVNAARNIRLEGRKAAAGQADAQNACGGTIRPGLAPAGPGETGTHRSAA
jgi:putative transposase